MEPDGFGRSRTKGLVLMCQAPPPAVRICVYACVDVGHVLVTGQCLFDFRGPLSGVHSLRTVVLLRSDGLLRVWW